MLDALRRTAWLLGLLWLVGAAATPLRAGEMAAYTDDAFAAAQKAGRPILIETFATWCDVCKRQKPILDKLLGEPRYRDLVTFRVDFDRQKDVMRRFKAPLQSTLIVFRGDREVGRSVGETQEEWIDDLLSKGGEAAKS